MAAGDAVFGTGHGLEDQAGGVACDAVAGGRGDQVQPPDRVVAVGGGVPPGVGEAGDQADVVDHRAFTRPIGVGDVASQPALVVGVGAGIAAPVDQPPQGAIGIELVAGLELAKLVFGRGQAGGAVEVGCLGRSSNPRA